MIDMISYSVHKAYTVTLEISALIASSIVVFIEKLDTTTRLAGGIVAVAIGVCAIIRAYWEIKIKRREHERLVKELELKDQEIDEFLEARKYRKLLKEENED